VARREDGASVARTSTDDHAFETPKGTRRVPFRGSGDRDRFGRFTEWIARAMGTPWFLFGLTFFVIVWMLWNWAGPTSLQFDRADYGFTALTLVLSLQASYAAPLILLAQNRQDDRDRVQIEQDRRRSERNLADVEYLAREVVALRLALKEVVTKEVIRAELRTELRALLDERDTRDGERE